MSTEQPRSDKHGATTVVHLGTCYDGLDAQALAEVQRLLLTCADVPETQNLVVDLAHTKFFGSTFIEVLFRAHNRMKRKGGKLALCGLLPYPLEVIRVSKLDMLWSMFANADDAVKTLNAESRTTIQ